MGNFGRYSLMLGWLLIYIVMATTVGARIMIDKEPKDVLIKEGEPAILECVGHSSSSEVASYRCSWLKDGTVMFVGEGKRKQFYDWIGDYRSGNCSIMLQNTLVSRHQGKWRCQIINTETDDNEMASTSSALVTILVAPTLPEVQDKSGNRLQELTIVEGQRHELHCISRHGNPAAYLRWELNGQDVSGNATYYNNSEPSLAFSGDSGDAGNTLRMYTAGSWLNLVVNRTFDHGLLQCLSRHAAFSEDRVQNTSVRLNIIYPPKNMSNDNNLTVAMDESVELDCPLDGKPTPSYIWYQLRKTDPIGFQKLLKLDNLSDNLMDTGYYCSASTLMESQNLTAYSGMFLLTPLRSAELDLPKIDDEMESLPLLLAVELEESTSKRKLRGNSANRIEDQPKIASKPRKTRKNKLPLRSQRLRTNKVKDEVKIARLEDKNAKLVAVNKEQASRIRILTEFIELQETARYLVHLRDLLEDIFEDEQIIPFDAEPALNVTLATNFETPLAKTSGKKRSDGRFSEPPKIIHGRSWPNKHQPPTVDIGNGVLISKDDLDNITRGAAGSATKFARNLMALLFTEEELRNKTMANKSKRFEVLDPDRKNALIVDECFRDDVALYLVIALGTFAVISLAFEFVMLVYFKCHQKNAPGQSFFRNTIYELYYTRGRKMALVHVRGEHDDKGGKGYTLHISAPFVSVFILLLDLLTIAAYVISVIFCYYENSCHCTFVSPSIICTIIFGSMVIILQLVFLASFCIRKKEDSKYRSYARRKEDVPGAGNDGSPKHEKNSASIISPSVPEQNENTIKQSNKNDRNRTEVPGSVPV